IKPRASASGASRSGGYSKPARVGFDSVRSMTGLPARRRSMRARVRRLGVRLAGTRVENIVVVELTTIDYFDPFDDLSFGDRVHHIHARQDVRKNGVLMVEGWVVDQIDKDLRVAGVTAAGRNSDGAAHVRPLTDFVAHERGVTNVFVRARAASLNDEVRNDAMERQTVVIA